MLKVPPSPFFLRLLEGVVDGDREAGMRLFGKTLHRLPHPGQKKGLRLFLVPMPVRSGNQFLGLGDSQRGKEVGKDWTERAAQPDVEEVREVRVSNVVVVGRVGRNHFFTGNALCPCIRLFETGLMCPFEQTQRLWRTP